MKSSPYSAWLSLVGVLVALNACGDEGDGGTGDDQGASSSSSSSSSGGSAVDADVAAPMGSCRFTVERDGQRKDYEWKVRARMNGSGNLLVRCEDDDGGAGELTLHFGNATFDGPRTYLADDFSSDGSVLYSTDPSAGSYASSEKGASCTLVLVEAAPLDRRGDSVEKDGTVAATFTCSAVISDSAVPPRVAIESGSLRARVE